VKTLLVGVLVLVACESKAKLKWKAQELSSAELGPFTIKYPQGWRDLRESADPSLERLGKRAGENAHVLVREGDTNTDTNIALDWNGPIENFNAVTCDAFAKGMAVAGEPPGDVQEVPFGTDRGCQWELTDGGSNVRMWTRFHGDNFAVIACLRPKKGDDDADEACARVVEALQRQ
jgi:hypothetical protein